MYIFFFHAEYFLQDTKYPLEDDLFSIPRMYLMKILVEEGGSSSYIYHLIVDVGFDSGFLPLFV